MGRDTGTAGGVDSAFKNYEYGPVCSISLYFMWKYDWLMFILKDITIKFILLENSEDNTMGAHYRIDPYSRSESF